jgi:transcription antitermination factor NusG
VIPEAEISTIKRFLNEHTNVMLEKTSVRVNDKVRVLNGPLMEQEGQVLSVRNKTVKIVLPSLGYMMYAEVETANVEVMHKNVTPLPVMSYPLYAIK